MVQCYSFKISFCFVLVCFLLASFVVIPTVLTASTNPTIVKQNEYEEGKLYVEIKARYKSMNWEYNQALHKPKHHGLKRWIMQYHITKIEKIKGKEQKNAYHFYFKKTHLTEAFIGTLKNLPYIQKVAQIPISSILTFDNGREFDHGFEESRKPNLVLVPTAFSPNNDNSNDYFQVKGQNILAFELQIFNRLGETIYQINESDEYGWDGTVNGRVMPASIYAYYGWVRFENGETKVLKGYLTLMD